MANQRQGVPAGWTWREGRPRWKASPTLRQAGWKDRDLKTERGEWLGRGASIDAAAALAGAVQAWRAGRLVPHAFAACAPPGACEKAGAGRPATLADRRSIGALLDAYLASREFTEKLKAKTQEDRRSKLSRLVDVLAGYVEKPRPVTGRESREDPDVRRRLDALAKYKARREQVRSLSIDSLEPPAFEAVDRHEDAHGPLYDVYWKLHDQVGDHMAHGVLANVSAWLEWCYMTRAIPSNWAQLVNRAEPPGRIRVGTADELAALIKAAEAMGLASIADSIILGVDLSWSQADRLALTWAQIDKAGRVKGTRQKTGRKGETPLLDGLGKPRIAVIRQRQKERYGENVEPIRVLMCELTGKAWSADLYRHKFAEVRELAAQDCPSVATLRDQDLRDTAVTWAHNAGLDHPQIASRTLHSLKRIADVLDKHYAEIGQEIADAGAAKLNAYIKGRGIKL